MTFTYASTLADTLDMVRFYIGDTVENNGPRPDGGNFTDEEIIALAVREGDVTATVAALYERLSGDWAKYVDTKIGPRDEKLSQVAARYVQLAKEWRSRPVAGADQESALGLFYFDMDIDRNRS